MPLTPMNLPKERKDELVARLGINGQRSGPELANDDAVLFVYDLSEKPALTIPNPVNVNVLSNIKRSTIEAYYERNIVPNGEPWNGWDVPILGTPSQGLQDQPFFRVFPAQDNLPLCQFVLNGFCAVLSFQVGPEMGPYWGVFRARIVLRDHDIPLGDPMGLRNDMVLWEALLPFNITDVNGYEFVFSPGLQDQVFRYSTGMWIFGTKRYPKFVTTWPAIGISNAYHKDPHRNNPVMRFELRCIDDVDGFVTADPTGLPDAVAPRLSLTTDASYNISYCDVAVTT